MTYIWSFVFLRMTREELVVSLQGRVARSPATGISQFFPSTKRIAEFSTGQQPKQGDRVIYVTGAFDLFHVGHLKFLEKAMDEGDYLLVGIHTDPVSIQVATKSRCTVRLIKM